MKLARLALIMPLVFACGYSAVYGGRPPEALLSVVASPQFTPETDAVAAVLAGVRKELSKQGALKGGTSYPRLVIQVLRVDEEPLGIAVQPARDGQKVALARGMEMAVTARGWVVEREGGEPVTDTGDVRRSAGSASEAAPAIDLQARVMAIRAAGNEVGIALARRVLGEATAGTEPL